MKKELLRFKLVRKVVEVWIARAVLLNEVPDEELPTQLPPPRMKEPTPNLRKTKPFTESPVGHTTRRAMRRTHLDGKNNRRKN